MLVRRVGQAGRPADRQHYDGRRFTIRLRHTPEGILSSRALLHGKHPDAPARVQAAEGVSHVQTGALLAHDDGAYVDLCRGLDDGTDRVVDYKLDAFPFENFGNSRRAVHGLVPFKE